MYPGVTEEVCGPELEKASGFVAGEDFFLAYSPERINPGARERTIDKIVKIVSGQTPDVADIVAEVYGAIVTAGIHRASSIRVAEAAKVIENAQRDINIAFVNELAIIFDKMGIDTREVLEAAETKWNFLDFRPGLVGGHCIGVDPYYLTFKAQMLGHSAQTILSGRTFPSRYPQPSRTLHENIVGQRLPLDALGGSGESHSCVHRNSRPTFPEALDAALVV